MFGLLQTFRPDSRGTSNRASGTRSGVRRWYSKVFKQLSGINIIEGKKHEKLEYIRLQIILSPVKKFISLKNICLCTLGLEQAVSLRTPSLLAAISQQSLEEVSKSSCEISFLPSLNYLDLEAIYSMFQVASLWTETRLTSVLGGLQLYKHSFESQPSLESSWDIIIIIIPISPACTLGITPLPKS